MSVFTDKSAYYVGLVLASTSQRNENFYFQFKFTNILSRVCFIAFFSKLTVDTVLSLKRFSRQIVMVKMWADFVNFRI